MTVTAERTAECTAERRPRASVTTTTVTTTTVTTSDAAVLPLEAADLEAAMRALGTSRLTVDTVAETIEWARAQEEAQHAEQLRMLDLQHRRRLALLTRMADQLGEQDIALGEIATRLTAALTVRPGPSGLAVAPGGAAG